MRSTSVLGFSATCSAARGASTQSQSRCSIRQLPQRSSCAKSTYGSPSTIRTCSNFSARRSTVVPGNGESLFPGHNVSTIWVLFVIIWICKYYPQESRQVLERPGPCRSYKNRRGEDDTRDLEGHGIPSRAGCAAWRSQGTNSSSQNDHLLR